MLTRQMLELLLCPACGQGELKTEFPEDRQECENGTLNCSNCAAEFAVSDGIANLHPSLPEDSEAWKTWQDHLQGFEARRAIRQAGPGAHQSTRWGKKLKAFADFIDAPPGRMLDVGCGPGNLRKYLDPNKTAYYGIDPIPLAEAREFAFVCGVAESLPFQDGTFSSIVVRSALDHFCDLDKFFAEADRVLTDDGKIFLEQVVHGGDGIGGTVKNAVHAVKDILDDVKTRKQRNSAPKHMREFSQSSLMNHISQRFVVSEVTRYTSNWYTPTQVFVCLLRA